MISVVIPVYNRSTELRRALNSLVAQTEKNFEALVIDDGSEEDIESVIHQFKNQLNIRYFRLEHSGGPAKARNKGIKEATGEWISFLDSDDWWMPTRIQVISNHLTSDIDFLYHPLKLAYSKLRINFATPFLQRIVGRAMIGDPLTYMLSTGNPIPTSSAVARKSYLLKVGSMNGDKALVSLEDFDTWLKLARQSARFKFLDQLLGYYWVGTDNISNISQRQIDRQRKLFEYHCVNLTIDLAGWANSYNNYVIGTYLLKLKKPRAAMASFEAANSLKYRSQRIKRRIKMFISVCNLIFSKHNLD